MSLEKHLVKKFPVLGSSQSPEELSMTIRGAVLLLLPVISLALVKFGVSQETLTELVNGVFGLIAAGMILLGTFRKFKK